MAVQDRTLWQVTAPHFCAGLILTGDTCTDAAPILRWCVGRERVHLRGYFLTKGWISHFVAKLEER